MQLYMVQHGEAKPKDEDPDRYLTDKGVQDVKKMAQFIRPLDLNVRAVWHSNKTRAVQTAEILGAALQREESLIEWDDLSPTDPVNPIIQKLKTQEEDIMIVGHLPFLSKLISMLITGDENKGLVAFRNGAVVCLQGDSEGSWKLAWMMTPTQIS